MFTFSIDRGGTFTDIYAEYIKKDGDQVLERLPIVMKLLSEDPSNYSDAPREGIRRIMEKCLGEKIPTSKDIDTSKIGWIRMGTTVATNALLERKGEKCVLVTTKGFEDLLRIGNQSRPRIFDLEIKKPSLLYSKVIEVEERVQLLSDNDENVKFKQMDSLGGQVNESIVKTSSGQWIKIISRPNYEKLKEELKSILEHDGIKSIAVLFIHSYLFPDHEENVGKIAKELGFQNVSLSHQVMPMVRAVPRGLTTCVDAYLTPIIQKYIENFRSGFKDHLSQVNVTFMQSDGGLALADHFLGCRAILSGPAGGYVGYSSTAYEKEGIGQKNVQAVIGFDMGGTSTDVSRFGGEYEHTFETELAGVTIQAPQLDISTVAAGGGSRLFFRSGLFVVGPESSGSHPGPVCYRKNGPLSVTDANLFLGRVLPEYFPKIFGPNENEPLDYEATKKAFQDLTAEINDYLTKVQGSTVKMTEEEVAFGFIKVANESMCRPIRSITVAKGYDTRNHILSCFGGAGAQHACAIAEALGMKRVKIHRHSGILSAYGLGKADVVQEIQEPCASRIYNEENLRYLKCKFAELRKTVIDQLLKQHDKLCPEDIKAICYLNLRYQGTDYSIMTNLPDNGIDGDFLQEFERRYKREYGFTITGRDVIVDDIRVRGIGQSSGVVQSKIAKRDEPSQLLPISYSQTYFAGLGRHKTPVYDLNSLCAFDNIKGPCIIIHDTTTIVVTPNATAHITEYGNVELSIDEESASSIQKRQMGTKVDAIQLSIFSHRFMSIAEQMGRTLQRTAISTNIKERLDFSCAIFSPSGGLVANAPHLPVHLGSMSEAVKFQIQYLGDGWKEGEVLVSNHPKSGGTHLPDITVITPVFKDGKPVFYVASRGHHADIGGISPGSMPPNSRFLSEEGAHIKSFKLVKDGKFQLEGITEIMKHSRNLNDNIADLKAQVAANQKGIHLIQELIQEYSLPIVHAYMKHVQDNAEKAVQDLLDQVVNHQNTTELNACDYMDDGSKIELRISIKKGSKTEPTSAVFDFDGTTEQVLGNTNAPKSIALSAILYCLRCLVNQEIPLNEGCIKPIEIKIPKNSLLDPDEEFGVVGGNVLTSQRITDVILRAFKACSASQGCMNNLTFGNEKMGYYETIAGGAGAGPTWHGQDAVHTHMTNTRITDVEILEKRYPVLLRQFSIRKNSGGSGKYKGGNGVIREFEFLAPLHVAILSERRVTRPYGLFGGKSGQRGKNLYLKHKRTDNFDKKNEDYIVCNLGPKNSVHVNVGDRILILTPGGGGFGEENNTTSPNK